MRISNCARSVPSARDADGPDAGEKGALGPTVSGRWLTAADRALAAALGALLLWVALTAWWSDRDVTEGIQYWAVPLVLGAGAVIGRLCAHRGVGPFLVVVPAMLVVTAVVLAPFYSNAEAAAGVQLVALSGLLLAGADQRRWGARTGSVTVLLAGGVGVTGLVLAARSQAALAVVVLVVALSVLAVSSWAGPSRRAIRGVGLASIASAASAVMVLGAAPVWPAWLRHPESLSGARHRLWSDALALWSENPVLGGGPGSFLAFSETARSRDLYYAAHSSILQVAAELGAIGVVLFLAVLVAGAFVATQGDPARGLIGVAAWCALAVHSMIDHLYEFPIVCLLAGLVIGWAGSRSPLGAPPHRPRRLSVE